ncbi:EAL domain-containing protein [Vibrio cholerae]|nr:EAL domain-containing protein [Vibrio cholerae]
MVKNVSFDLDHSGQPIRGYGVVQDITEQKLTEAKIRHLADIDELTGLPNRRRGIELAEDTVEKSAHQKKSVALIYIDLDKFKEINDIHGHAIGDSVLAVIGQRFLEKTSVDSVFSRLGGDEFMLAHSFSCYEALNEEISGLLEAVSKPLQIGDIALQLEASIGAAVFPEQGHCVETLMQYADIAMYQAKKMGSAFQFYSTELGEYHTRQIILASKLKRAIDESTLQVYFQPKVCFSKGKLCGIEALARWHDPEYGWISPTEFIKVAENNGLISRLDDWSLATVCSYWRTWRDEGLALPASISVNVSARQLSDNTFLDRALVLIKQYKISPEDIDFEITETALFDDLSKVQEIVIKLVSSGFSLSIDDFGTGYSSLSRLHKLSISQLKIDMSFIQDMLTNQSSLSIVTAVINMAKVLNLNTIAEGVETKEQHEMLAKLGCDQGQGYYYSRPLSVDVFMSNWLKT